MDDAAVVRAGVEAGAGMPLDHADRSSALGDRERRSEAGHAGSDHSDVDLLHHNAWWVGWVR